MRCEGARSGRKLLLAPARRRCVLQLGFGSDKPKPPIPSFLDPGATAVPGPHSRVMAGPTRHAPMLAALGALSMGAHSAAPQPRCCSFAAAPVAVAALPTLLLLAVYFPAAHCCSRCWLRVIGRLHCRRPCCSPGSPLSCPPVLLRVYESGRAQKQRGEERCRSVPYFTVPLYYSLVLS